MKWRRVVKITRTEPSVMYDIWNKEPDCLYDQGNFVLDDSLVHNSIPEAVANRDGKNPDWEEQLRDIHVELAEILKDTYGVIVWQEQLAMIWQRLAGFTAPEAQEARKAVAKKWVHLLEPIGKKWVEGASKSIGQKQAEEWWEKMVTFGRYAFNKCLHKDTRLTNISFSDGKATSVVKTVEEWHDSGELPTLLSYVDGALVTDRCVSIHVSEQEVYELMLSNGQVEKVTLDHKFLCDDGLYHTVREIYTLGLEMMEVDNAIINQ